MTSTIKEFAKNRLNKNLYKRIKSIGLFILTIPFGSNMNKLALIYKTDKWGKHHYTEHYTTHFRRFKFRRIKLFEIGVGGYHFPDRGGSSLRMWKRYFPFGRIFAMDNYDKSFFEERRIRIFQGSQVDELALNKFLMEIGQPNIIIDDGSHVTEHVIKTFELLFPKLKIGGIYVVEDAETSYWPDYGGDSENLANPSTIMNYFKRLTDCLNHQEIPKENYQPTYFDKHIVSMHFYHNLIFIYKGLNDERSNVDFTNPSSIEADVIYV